jgi:hypothetical protein
MRVEGCVISSLIPHPSSFLSEVVMHKQGSVLLGVLFIVAGLFFLAAEFWPGLAELVNFVRLWPLILLGLGVLFLLQAVVNEPGTAVPGVILTTIGSILLYQNITGHWGFWQLWLLIPGAVGVGILLYSLLDHKLKETWPAVLILIGVSTVLFLIFTGGMWLNWLWPLALIVAGFALLLKNLRHKTK